METAFRLAERRFKASHCPSSEADVLDTSNLHDVRLAPYPCSLPGVYSVSAVPGLLLLPSYLTVEDQVEWITDCYQSYTQPPFLTNLHAHESLPETGLWALLKASQEEQEREQILKRLRKVRWATIGQHYDWSSKLYTSIAHAIPPKLVHFFSALAEELGFKNYRPEAGIVNCYQPKDTLSGHVDNAETSLEHPLFSLSLGASCIFLIGGQSKEDAVTPVLLRGGDVLVMSGEARLSYHGVPRILSPPPISPLLHNEDQRLAMEILGRGRLNLNIRQIH